MEDIPYLHDQAQARQFHDVVSSQLQSSSFPMVLVLTTSEDESTALPRGMYSLLPFEILHSPLVTLLKYASGEELWLRLTIRLTVAQNQSSSGW